jgi:hypothetical protein
MDEKYRVVFWVEGTIKVTAPTHYSDAYDTAKKWKGELYKEVASFKEGVK